MSDRLEILISRRLDGELSDADSRELDALLASDPAAQRLFSQAARVDRMAAAALPGALSADQPCPAIPVRSIGWRREWINHSLVAAIAACLAMVVLFRGDPSSQPPTDLRTGRPSTRVPAGAVHTVGDSPVWYTPVQQPALRHQRVQQEYFGVKDPRTGRIYLLERRDHAVRTEPVTGSL
jgi:anti-sigma factor RsiW